MSGPDILDLFDLPEGAQQRALLKEVKKHERRREREEQKEAGRRLAEARAEILKPAPEHLVGVSLVVEAQTCLRCEEQTYHVCSSGVMLKYHRPERRLDRWGSERNYLVNSETTRWQRGSLPVNWRNLPRDIKYIETETPVCAECWERSGIIGIEDDCPDIEVFLEEVCPCEPAATTEPLDSVL